jgi:hypothetical protein
MYALKMKQFMSVFNSNQQIFAQAAADVTMLLLCRAQG